MMKFTPRQRNFLTYFAVGLAAAAIRIVCLGRLPDSPLSAFHLLPGLDMESHLKLGGEFAAGNSIFTVYRFLLAFLSVRGVILLQFAAGTGIALLTAYCAFRLFGRRLYALAAGLLAALYAPALMYEMSILQETVTVFFAFAAFAALLFARKRHFALPPSLAAGVLLGLAGTGRPVGLPFVAGVILWLVFYLRRRPGRPYRRLFPYLGAFAAVWLLAGSFNAAKGWPLPFYGGNIAYLTAVGGRAEINDWNIPETPVRPSVRLGGDLLAGFIRKLPRLFEARELPDNLNYYFIRDHFPPLRFLPGPLLLWPLGTAGLLLILCTRRWNRREGMLWLYAGTLMLFVAAYYPTGRHRLILYPALAMAAAHVLLSFFYCRDRRQRYFGPILAVAVLAANLIAMPEIAVQRIGDHFTWGLAMEKLPPGSGDPLPHFRRAATAAPQNRKYAAAYLNTLVRRSEWEELQSFILAVREPAPVHYYFLALSRLAAGEPEQAAALFARIEAAMIPELAVPYCYYRGESLRLSGRNREAAKWYRQGLEYRPTPEQRVMLETALKRMGGE